TRLLPKYLVRFKARSCKINGLQTKGKFNQRLGPSKGDGACATLGGGVQHWNICNPPTIIASL
ncbi:MAG TPA: hypothetical protein VJ733_11190, partial [Candidatus Binatia bacterium]|nr:hypothetical protein [Candidatus Binatia bacterium]